MADNDHLVDGVQMPRAPGTYAHRVVLRDLGPDRFERFVVHDYVEPDDDLPPYYVQGDYARDLENAMQHFRRRNGRNERLTALRAADAG